MSEGNGHEPRPVIWVVNDVESNHHLVRRSLPEGHESVCDVVFYLSAEDALADADVGFGADPTMLPDVVFMDFFLGGLYGNEATLKLRAAFAARGLEGPFIIGHSSSPPASLEIVRAGGDVAIEKDKRALVSPGVRNLFPDLASIQRYAGRASRPKPAPRPESV